MNHRRLSFALIIAFSIPVVAGNSYIVRFDSQPAALKQFDLDGYEKTVYDLLNAVSEPVADTYRETVLRRERRNYDAQYRHRVKTIQSLNAVSVDNRFKTVLRGVAVRIPHSSTGTEQLETVRHLDFVSSVAPDQPVTIDARAAYFSSGMNHDHIYNYKTMNVVKTWNLQDEQGHNLTGRGVHISTLGMGVDFDIQNFTTTSPNSTWRQAGNCPKFTGDSYDFHNDDTTIEDASGHGTEVSAVLTANGTGFTGVAYGADYSHYKVYDGLFKTVSNLVDGLDNATANGARVVSVSIGLTHTPPDFLQDAVRNARNNNTLLFSAAGNKGDNSGYYSVQYPGGETGVVTVGAAFPNTSIATYSSRGYVIDDNSNYYDHGIDIVAPGTFAVPTKGGGIEKKDGTSYAAPAAAGAAALILQDHPNLSSNEVMAVLGNSAWYINRSYGIEPGQTDNDGYGLDFRDYGVGMIDVYDSVRQHGFIQPYHTFRVSDTLVTENRNFTQNFTIENTENHDVTYSISFQEDRGDFATAYIENTSFTLPPGGSKEFNVTFEVSGDVNHNRGRLNVSTGSGPSFKATINIIYRGGFKLVSPENAQPGDTITYVFHKTMNEISEAAFADDNETRVLFTNGTQYLGWKNGIEKNYSYFKRTITVPSYLKHDYGNDLEVEMFGDYTSFNTSLTDATTMSGIINVTDLRTPNVTANQVSQNGEQTFIFVNMTADDNLGVQNVFLEVGGTSYTPVNNSPIYTKNITGLSYGSYDVKFTAGDGLHNTSYTDHVDLGEVPVMSDNWTKSSFQRESSVLVQLNSDNNRSADNITYRINGGSWTTKSGANITVTVTTQQNNTIEYYGTNSFGDGKTHTEYVALDSVAPSLSFNSGTTKSGNYTQQYIFMNVTASDNVKLSSVSLQSSNFTGSFTDHGGYRTLNKTGLDYNYYEYEIQADDHVGNAKFLSTQEVTLFNDTSSGTTSSNDTDSTDSGGSGGSGGGGGGGETSDTGDTAEKTQPATVTPTGPKDQEKSILELILTWIKSLNPADRNNQSSPQPTTNTTGKQSTIGQDNKTGTVRQSTEAEFVTKGNKIVRRKHETGIIDQILKILHNI